MTASVMLSACGMAFRVFAVSSIAVVTFTTSGMAIWASTGSMTALMVLSACGMAFRVFAS